MRTAVGADQRQRVGLHAQPVTIRKRALLPEAEEFDRPLAVQEKILVVDRGPAAEPGFERGVVDVLEEIPASDLDRAVEHFGVGRGNLVENLRGALGADRLPVQQRTERALAGAAPPTGEKQAVELGLEVLQERPVEAVAGQHLVAGDGAAGIAGVAQPGAVEMLGFKHGLLVAVAGQGVETHPARIAVSQSGDFRLTIAWSSSDRPVR